ncbi:LACH-like protein [Mya arenaria]|uniref:LACH-like protein n=2 Tax=Mya arenaria TaxID=6604 RepID=A0ABY7DVW0_MYAAR|nr:LACH-like protein [Mya arenaria]
MNPKRILISTEDRRVIDDTRMSIERPFVRDWNLHIRNVQTDDDGEYTCQINTDPIQIKRIRLKVQVPAEIENKTSSGNVTVNEGDKVELTCQASGVPEPSISWFRRTAQTNNAREHVGTVGELLIIHNISRYCGGLYECEASNNIAPPARRLINVQVAFSPEVRFKTPRRISQELGKEALLECFVSAFPHGVSTWTRNGREVIGTGQYHRKYRTDIYKEDGFTLALYLRILNLEPADFGTYACEASNSLGNDRDTIVLYEYYVPTPPPTTRAPVRQPEVWTPTENLSHQERKYDSIDRGEISAGERAHAVSGTSHISGFVGASNSYRPNSATLVLHTALTCHLALLASLVFQVYYKYTCS